MNQVQEFVKFHDMLNTVKNYVRKDQTEDVRAAIRDIVEFVRTLYTNGIIGPDEHRRLIRTISETVFEVYVFE